MQQKPLSPGGPALDKYLEHLYVCYYEPMMAYAYRIVEDEILAEEIVIDAFLKVKKAHPDFTSLKNPQSYLFITVRNLCYDAITEKKIQSNFLKDVAAQPPTYTEMEVFLHESLQIGDLVKIALSKLTPSEKKIIEMSFLEEMSVKEIAKELGRTENGVAAEKSKALRKLRENNKDLPKGLTIFLIIFLQLMDQNFF